MSSKVQSAVFNMLTSANVLEANLIAWENRTFNPPSSGHWYSVFYREAQPVVATLGENGEDHIDGFIQIDINCPSGNGDTIARTKYDALRNVFTAGAKSLYQGQEVTIVSCGRSGGRMVNSHFRVSVTVMFYANVQR